MNLKSNYFKSWLVLGLVLFFGSIFIILTTSSVQATEFPKTPNSQSEVQCSKNKFKAQYFNSLDLSREAVHTRCEEKIDYNWKTESPIKGKVNQDFSVRWSGTFSLKTGTYKFTTKTDDGVRLYVNDKIVINDWKDHSVKANSVEVEIKDKSDVKIVMEYYDRQRNALANLDWSLVYPDCGDQYLAKYKNKNDKTWKVVRCEEEIDYNWNGRSPADGIQRENFEAQWEKTQTFDGKYKINLVGDDEAKLFIDDKKVAEVNWQKREGGTWQELDLKGSKKIKITFKQGVRAAYVKLHFEKIATEIDSENTIKRKGFLTPVPEVINAPGVVNDHNEQEHDNSYIFNDLEADKQFVVKVSDPNIIKSLGEGILGQVEVEFVEDSFIKANNGELASGELAEIFLLDAKVTTSTFEISKPQALLSANDPQFGSNINYSSTTGWFVDYTGNVKYAVIGCKASDSNLAPIPRAKVSGMMDYNVEYFKQTSYGKLNISYDILDNNQSWITLPGKVSDYTIDTSTNNSFANFNRQCIDAYRQFGFNPTNYNGIITMANFNHPNAAGLATSRYLVRDTFNANLGRIVGAITLFGKYAEDTWVMVSTHEIGHIQYLPHSGLYQSTATGAEYNNPWSVMGANYRYDSVSKKYVPTDEIAYYKDRRNWIDDARRFRWNTGEAPKEITIEPVASPGFKSGTFQVLYVKPSTNLVYTFEVRDFNGYDKYLPFTIISNIGTVAPTQPGVVMHVVDLNDSQRKAMSLNPNTKAYQVGEEILIPNSSIKIKVCSKNGSDYTLAIDTSCGIGTIQGNVFADTLNFDGIDNDFVCYGNIKVELLDEIGNPALDISNQPISTFSNDSCSAQIGNYQINGVRAGKYKLKFSGLSKYEIATKKGLASNESNINYNDYTTDVFEITSTNTKITKNAGFIQFAKVSGYLFKDLNVDGRYNPADGDTLKNDANQQIVLINAVDGAAGKSSEQAKLPPGCPDLDLQKGTLSDGSQAAYSFNCLYPGTYKVKIYNTNTTLPDEDFTWMESSDYLVNNANYFYSKSNIEYSNSKVFRLYLSDYKTNVNAGFVDTNIDLATTIEIDQPKSEYFPGDAFTARILVTNLSNKIAKLDPNLVISPVYDGNLEVVDQQNVTQTTLKPGESIYLQVVLKVKNSAQAGNVVAIKNEINYQNVKDPNPSNNTASKNINIAQIIDNNAGFIFSGIAGLPNVAEFKTFNLNGQIYGVVNEYESTAFNLNLYKFDGVKFTKVQTISQNTPQGFANVLDIINYNNRIYLAGYNQVFSFDEIALKFSQISALNGIKDKVYKFDIIDGQLYLIQSNLETTLTSGYYEHTVYKIYKLNSQSSKFELLQQIDSQTQSYIPATKVVTFDFQNKHYLLTDNRVQNLNSFVSLYVWDQITQKFIPSDVNKAISNIHGLDSFELNGQRYIVISQDVSSFNQTALKSPAVKLYKLENGKIVDANISFGPDAGAYQLFAFKGYAKQYVLIAQDWKYEVFEWDGSNFVRSNDFPNMPFVGVRSDKRSYANHFDFYNLGTKAHLVIGGVMINNAPTLNSTPIYTK